MTLPGGAHIEGWEVVFYVFGLFGVVWFPFFVWRVYNTPDEDPSISSEELTLIKTGELLTILFYQISHLGNFGTNMAHGLQATRSTHLIAKRRASYVRTGNVVVVVVVV